LKSPKPTGISEPSSQLPDSALTAPIALLLILIANFALQPVTEPDFGWHLRTGMDLMIHGWTVLGSDPYSHTMPDWIWIEHAWLSDVLIAAVYRESGLLGVIMLFAGLTATAWIMASRSVTCHIASALAACALSLWVALPFLGARTQMVTYLGLGTLLFLLKRFADGDRLVPWTIPPLFLLWTNLHGGFTAGLFLLGIVLSGSLLTRLMEARWPSLTTRIDERSFSWSELKQLGVATAVAAALTLVNPYGWRLYTEIVDSLSNQYMLTFLQEWQPVSLGTYAGRSYVMYLIGLGMAMALWYRRIEPVRWMVWASFLFFSLFHLRNILFFLIVSLPLLAQLLEQCVVRLLRWWPGGLGQIRLGQLGLTLAGGLFLLWLGAGHLEDVVRAGLQPEEYFMNTSYPMEAVRWIRDQHDVIGHRMYNDYAHGGFLEWWLPEQKVFVDGRMPAWRLGERWIAKDYAALALTNPPMLSILDKYAVDWAIVVRHTTLDQALSQQTGWKRVYGDRKVSLYVRAVR
jgi:hypothetical protein